MKNEYRFLNQPNCIHASDLDFTVEREDLVEMLGFCPAVNGHGALDGNGRAEATDAIPADESIAWLLGSRSQASMPDVVGRLAEGRKRRKLFLKQGLTAAASAT
jgi:hypothetical protein